MRVPRKCQRTASALHCFVAHTQAMRCCFCDIVEDSERAKQRHRILNIMAECLMLSKFLVYTKMSEQRPLPVWVKTGSKDRFDVRATPL